MTSFALQCRECEDEFEVKCAEVVVQPLFGHWHGFMACPSCETVNAFSIENRAEVIALKDGGAEIRSAPRFTRSICSVGASLMPLTSREVEAFADAIEGHKVILGAEDEEQEDTFGFLIQNELGL